MQQFGALIPNSVQQRNITLPLASMPAIIVAHHSHDARTANYGLAAEEGNTQRSMS